MHCTPRSLQSRAGRRENYAMARLWLVPASPLAIVPLTMRPKALVDCGLKHAGPHRLRDVTFFKDMTHEGRIDRPFYWSL